MASLFDLFERVLAGYLRATREPMTSHPMGIALRRDIPQAVRDVLTLRGFGTELTTGGSGGSRQLGTDTLGSRI
jgi:hypothetical protein